MHIVYIAGIVHSSGGGRGTGSSGGGSSSGGGGVTTARQLSVCGTSVGFQRTGTLHQRLQCWRLECVALHLSKSSAPLSRSATLLALHQQQQECVATMLQVLVCR